MKTAYASAAIVVSMLTATSASAGGPAHGAHHRAAAQTAAGAYAVDAASQQGDLAGVPIAERGGVITWKLVTNGPVPDTAATRSQYPPLSHAGRRSAPKGN